jgi:diacylglycerol kinase (ATP)
MVRARRTGAHKRRRMGIARTVRNVTIICRQTSRHGVAYFARLQEELPKRGVRIVEAHMVRRRSALQKRIKHAIKAGGQIVVVVGGDGTQTAAVDVLAHAKTVMAVVPAGTGNSFALSLGIRADLDEAIETIASGKELRVDLGTANGTHFANFATVGLIADAANRTPTFLKKIVGPAAYVVGGIAPLFEDKPFEMRVRRPGDKMQFRTYQAIVASGRYFGWKPVTPNATIRTGNLAFFTAEGSTPADVFRVNAALLRGDHTQIEGAHFFSDRTIEIRCKPAQPVNIDGHHFGKTPVIFKIAPRALRVLVPNDFKPKA